MASADAEARGIQSQEQFWTELAQIVAVHCDSHELIDEALRTYLGFTSIYKDRYLRSEYDLARCSYALLDSALFAENQEYVRRQIIACLLQEDDPAELQMIAAFLLFDGKQSESTFEEMNEEEIFPRILELIQTYADDDPALHRILLRLLYEMSRIQRIKVQELMLIEDDFILRLLQITETLSDDVSDPYHYPVIRVLLVLSEQYMVSAHDPTPSQMKLEPLQNKVIALLAEHGHAFKTFGENIILLLNRESETSLQLLILKLLYLLFTTPATYEYFYTNDLRVLVDVVIRNLLDLPRTAAALRHTYLRVLHPLLAHTQLADPDNHYKREELRKVLSLLAGTGPDGGLAHFGATDETTKRLGARCVAVPWLQSNEELEASSPTIVTTAASNHNSRHNSTSNNNGNHHSENENDNGDEDHPPSISEDSPTEPEKQEATDKMGVAKKLLSPKKRTMKKKDPPPLVKPRKGSTTALTTAAAAAAAALTPRSSSLSAAAAPPPPPPHPLPLPPHAHAHSHSPSPPRRAVSATRVTPSPPPPRKGSSATRLVLPNAAASTSQLSVAAVASPRAKPGVQTPSRRRGRVRGFQLKKHDDEADGDGDGEGEEDTNGNANGNRNGNSTDDYNHNHTYENHKAEAEADDEAVAAAAVAAMEVGSTATATTTTKKKRSGLAGMWGRRKDEEGVRLDEG